MKLLSPLAIGPATARNRVFFGAHETNLGAGRALSERHVAYYRRRAAAGVGMIVVEDASVHPSDWPYERAPLATECSQGWAAIAAACHGEGSLVLAGLSHAGGQGSSAYSQGPLWAPSRVPEVNTREVPKWMEPEDIAAVVEGFAAAAAAAVAAGCDGVQVNAGQHSLVRQFLSGLTNQRDDEWGGDRLRFAGDVLVAIRSAIGPDAVLSLRLSCDELAPWAGLTPESAAQVAVALVSEPDARVDTLTVVRGSIFSVAATRPDGHTEAGFNLDLAATIRDALSAAGTPVPVIAQGSIVDIGQAEWAVGDGARADGVEMTRALLADAELVAKVAAGAPERVRPCLLCNQTCSVRDARNPIVTCVVDPRSGHELDDPDESVGRGSGDVLVIGGGVAGMEAARVAARRGHNVRLVERSDRLGGALRTAASGSGRERLAAIAEWLESECRDAGVVIELGRSASPEELSGDVVVAVGSVQGGREYTVTRAAVVRSAAELLAAPEAAPQGDVLIWDPIGGPIGISVAELLASKGRSVHLVTPDNIVGNELSRSGDLAPANARLHQAGVQLHRRSILRAVKKGSVELEDRFSGERRTLRAAVVVDAGHRLPDTTFDAAVGVVRAGDCVAPRTIHEAILEGRRAALALDGIGRLSDGVPMGSSQHG
ncbi:MAG: mycofactocin system FadH/OYE family oxidoreductase 1 [Microthrixaceae bacterium]|nr:mycofactocin system FadH/OYE family oxidoreductase 1 [Microthrixaceae bacterium]